MLLSFLDFHRTVMLRKCADLSSEQLHMTTASSSLTLGRILRHLAFVEDHWFTAVLHDRPYPELWQDADWEQQRDWEMDTAVDFSPAELAEQFGAAIDRSRAAIEHIELDASAARASPTGPTNLRWILIHMIEEYARHCGHADLLRESIDGRVGD